MTISIDDLIPQVRNIIDEVKHDAEEDFSTDLEKEIRQAIIYAAQKMKRELGRAFLIPKRIDGRNTSITVNQVNSDGVGTISLPADFGEIVELQMSGWQQPVTSLIEPGTNEARQQMHPWTRGNHIKPKAMMTLDSAGNNVIEYFTAARQDGNYVHELQHMDYMPIIDGDTRSLPIADDMYDVLVYQSASIFMLSKGETQLAEQFASMGTLQPTTPAATE